MRVLPVSPILNVSDIAATISRLAKLGWTVGFKWHDDPEDPNSPVEFASVICGDHGIFRSGVSSAPSGRIVSAE